LEAIEIQEEHSQKKVASAVQRAESREGVSVHVRDHLEIQNMSDETVVGSPAGVPIMEIGGMRPSLKADMYIIGRDPDNLRELVYYKFDSGNVQKRDCGSYAEQTISRFDLVIIPDGNRVEIFNIGKNTDELYYEADVEI
jgi:hypothetical protein